MVFNLKKMIFWRILFITSFCDMAYNVNSFPISNVLKHFRVSTRASLNDDIPNDYLFDYKKLLTDFIVMEDRVIHSLFSPAEEMNKTPYHEEKKLVPEISSKEAESFLTKTFTSQQIQELSTLAIDENENNEINKEKQSFTLKIDKTLSKDERTLLHRSIRFKYPNIESKTEINSTYTGTQLLIVKKGVQSIIDENSSEKKRNGRSRKKTLTQRWDNSQPDYQHFTVIKSGLSTVEATEQLAKSSGLLPSRFSYCGSKDKRAVTFQRMSAWRVKPEQLSKKGKNLLTRDFMSSSREIKLGELAGNHFIITLRSKEEEISEESLPMNSQNLSKSIIKRITEISSNGFPNLFGIQRFGAPLPLNPEVGKCLLRGDFRAAVWLILLSPTTMEEVLIGGLNVDTVLRLLWGDEANFNVEDSPFFRGVYDRLEKYRDSLSGKMEKIANRDKIHRQILQRVDYLLSILIESFSDLEEISESDNGFSGGDSFVQRKLFSAINSAMNKRRKLLNVNKLSMLDNDDSINDEFLVERIDYPSIFSCLPTTLKALFVNSYQSVVFNDATLSRLSNYGQSKVIVGDIVLVDKERNPLTIWDVSRFNIPLNGDMIKPWNSSINDIQDDDNEYHNQDLKMNAKKCYYLVLHESDVESGKFSIDSVVMPLPGSHCICPPFVVEQLKNDGMFPYLGFGSTSKNGKSSRYPGAYRHLISTARNIRYFAPENDLKKLEGKAGDWVRMDQQVNNDKIEIENKSDMVSFSERTEELWKNNLIPSILNQLYYDGLSSKSLESTQSNINIPKRPMNFHHKSFSLPVSLLGDKPEILQQNSELFVDSKDLKEDNKFIVRLAFSLCSSSYATTFLDWLLCNKYK